MNKHCMRWLAAMMVGGLVLSSNAGAAEATTGSKLQPFALADQHDQQHSVTGKTRLLVFTREKDVGKMVFGVLGEKPATYLADRDAAFVMDISEMPHIITWAIAKPRMRRHPFRFLLDSEGQVSKAFPSRTGQATLLFLNDLTVQRVAFASTPEQLKKELEGLPPAK